MKAELTDKAKLNFATEVAFSTLLQEARRLGLPLNPCMGLMYLPKVWLIVGFKRICKSVIYSLQSK